MGLNPFLQAQGKSTLKATAQDLTTVWADLGGEIVTKGMRWLGLWLNMDINDGANVRVRIVPKLTAAATDEYAEVIETAGASSIAMETAYKEFNVDADILALVIFDLKQLVPVVQVQVQAGTVGAGACQIDSAYFTLGA